MNYNLEIRDSFGGIHKRKNQYIVDVLEGRTVDKNTHPYNINIRKFKNEEKNFLNSLKNIDANIKNEDSRQIKNLKIRFSKANKKIEFYKDYLDLTYDAVLEHDISKIEEKHIPNILSYYESLNKKLKESEKKLSSLSDSIIKEEEKEIALKKQEEDKIYREKLNEINKKFSDGLISKKAKKAESHALKKEHQENISQIELLNESTALKDKIANIKHRRKIDIKSMTNVMESDISNIRRTTPIEAIQKSQLFPT